MSHRKQLLGLFLPKYGLQTTLMYSATLEPYNYHFPTKEQYHAKQQNYKSNTKTEDQNPMQNIKKTHKPNFSKFYLRKSLNSSSSL